MMFAVPTGVQGLGISMLVSCSIACTQPVIYVPVQGTATAPSSHLVKVAKNCCGTKDDIPEPSSQLMLTPVMFH